MTREKAKQTFDEIDFLTWQIDIINNCIDKIFDDFEAQIKAKDEEIERLKKAIDTSIEEIEYAIKKPQYAEVYLGNAIRFLKENI